MSTPPHTLELREGYVDPQGTAHRRLTFARRTTGRDLFRADGNGGGQVAFECELYAGALQEFGGLANAAMYNAFLSLDEAERAQVEEGFEVFLRQTFEGHEVGDLVDDTVRLAFGITRDGVTYHLVTFGNRLRGHDEVAASKRRLTGIARACFLAGRRAVAISTADGAERIEGAVTIEDFERMDSADLFAVLAASQEWSDRWFDALQKTRAQEKQAAPEAVEVVNEEALAVAEG